MLIGTAFYIRKVDGQLYRFEEVAPEQMMRRSLCIVLLLLFATPAGGQANFGAIVGSVLDPSGRTIAGAKLTVTNLATNTVRTARTDTAGQYEVPGLIPGTYTIQVSASGFAPKSVTGVVIDVQSRQSADFTLAVGPASEQVTATAAPPLLETQSAFVGAVINSTQIVNLPLNGRHYSDLALLQAGVSTEPPGEKAPPFGFLTPDRFNVDGNLDLENDFLLDGTNNNSGSSNVLSLSAQAVQPPPDALSEFRIQTRTYSAEFGMSAGAVINVSIKSGTNQFHGDIWEFFRNAVLDANAFFNNANDIPRGGFQQNQFGGTLGGPIRRDKSFFFGDFQGLISYTALTEFSTVPTPLMKQGNFSELPASDLPLVPVVLSQTNCISGGDIVLAGCIDPEGSRLFNLYPNLNVAAAVAVEGQPNSFTVNNYQYVTSAPNHTYSTDVRFDQVINAANQVFARYSFNTQKFVLTPLWTSNPDVGNGNLAFQLFTHEQSVAIGWTYAISPSVVNQFHQGFNRVSVHANPIGVTVGISDAPQYGLTGLPPSSFAFGLPPISISGFQGLGGSSYDPLWQVSQAWQFTDSLSVLRGAHGFQFGFEYDRTSNAFLDVAYPQGGLSATGIFTSSNPVYGGADFLLGDMASASFSTPLVAYNYYPGSGYYAQDAWRTRKNLTITYGLRYEYYSPMLSRSNKLANFYPINGGEVVPVAPNASGAFARSTIHPDYSNFAPRLGFAYQMTKRVVWRGGYGIFYQHRDRIGSESMLALNPPFLSDTTFSQQLGSTTPVFQLKNGFPDSLFGNTVNLTTQQIRAQDPNQRTPCVEQASLETQFLVTPNTVFDVTGVGNWARRMERLRNANQGMIITVNGSPAVQFPYANLNNNATGQHDFLELATNDGNMNYAGLQLELNRQPKNGLSYGIDYTWSHSLADYVDRENGTPEPQNAYNYSAEMSNSAFNIGQRFVANLIWEIPVGINRRFLSHGNRLVDTLVGGWNANSIVTGQTGLPFNVSAPDESFTGPDHLSRPNCVGNPYAGATRNTAELTSNSTTAFYMNPAAFAIPAPYTFGNCPPRNLTAPGMQNVDFSLFKVVPIHEQRRAEIRAEFFNFLNHPNFGFPVSTLGSASFGHITSTSTPPRNIQLAAKIYF